MPSSLRSALDSYTQKLNALQPDIDRLKALREQLQQKLMLWNRSHHKVKDVNQEIGELEKALTPKILEVLLARDEVHTVLTRAFQRNEADFTLSRELIELDDRLRKNLELITQPLQLDDWCQSLGRPVDSWWWSSTRFIKQPTRKPIDLLLDLLTFICLVPALGLTVNIASRFLAGGPGVVGSIAIIFQSFIGLLASRSTLTSEGSLVTHKIIHSFRLADHHYSFVRLLLTACFLLISIGFNELLVPRFALQYYENGVRDYQEKRLSSAENNFNRVINLYPNGYSESNSKLNDLIAETHNRLGELYEDLDRLDDATQKYQLAMGSGSIQAYSNLARLYLLNRDDREQNYRYALSLLEQVKYNQATREAQYSVYTSLAWLKLNLTLLKNNSQQQNDPQYRYLNLKRLLEARDDLKSAIELYGGEEGAVINNLDEPADARCLLAQVLEQIAQFPAEDFNDSDLWEQRIDLNRNEHRDLIRNEWLGCVSQNKDPRRPYAVQWLSEAKQRTETQQ